MAKTALVVSGGGSKGSFAVGVIEVLRERGITFDLVTGTSTGALIAPLVATDEIALLHQLYTTVRTEDILILRRGLDILTGDAIHDTTPLWRLINAHMTQTRYDRLLRSPVDIFVCATNLQTGRATYFNPKRGKDGGPLSKDTFNRAIYASSSQPVLMPAVRIPYRVGDQFVDGGVREVAPIRKAIEEGSTAIYAIVLSPETREPTQESYVFVVDTLIRSLDVLLEEIALGDVKEAQSVNDVLQYLAQVRRRAGELLADPAQVEALFAPTPGVEKLLEKRVLELHVIRPLEELPSAGLDFSPVVMSQMLAMGREAAETYFAGREAVAGGSP